MARVSLILGGARSGKSARALALAEAGAPPLTFVATAEALDAEMADRIARHKAERGPEWSLVEAPLDLASVIAGHRRGTLLVDCLTLWLSNLMHAGRDPQTETAALVAALDPARSGTLHHINEESCPPRDPPPLPPAGYPDGYADDRPASPPRVILVSNEVGLSITPENALARRFRDEQGRLNQRIAAVADHVEFVAAGLPLALKGSP